MLLAEGDVVASVVEAAWYRDNVRYFDMRNKNSEVTDDELILQRHGFLLEKWRSVYGCFETRKEHSEHRQSGECPAKVLLSINDAIVHRSTPIRDLHAMLLAEKDVVVKIVTPEWYCENVRYFDMRRQRRQDDPHEDLNMYWDFYNPCKHCGFVYLMGVTSRSKCCGNGKFATEQPNSPLKPLLQLDSTLLLLSRLNDENTVEHLKFFERAWEYNNNISLGIVCVDHGDDGNAYADGERAPRKYNWWNPGFGDFCATIQGRTFLMLKKIGNRYGLDWATIGNANGALEKSLAANENLKKINKDILRSLLQDSFVDNPLVREVVKTPDNT